jgi:hypothetical protein
MSKPPTHRFNRLPQHARPTCLLITSLEQLGWMVALPAGSRPCQTSTATRRPWMGGLTFFRRCSYVSTCTSAARFLPPPCLSVSWRPNELAVDESETEGPADEGSDVGIKVRGAA